MKLYENIMFPGFKVLGKLNTLEDGTLILEGAVAETGPNWHGKVGHFDYWNPASFNEIVETVGKSRRRKSKPKE